MAFVSRPITSPRISPIADPIRKVFLPILRAPFHLGRGLFGAGTPAKSVSAKPVVNNADKRISYEGT